MAEVVERLVGHAAGERSVADHRDHVALATVANEFLALFEGYREAVGAGERRRGVRGLDPVVLALGTVGIARESTALAKVLEFELASREEFVDVGLVAGVPEQNVLG